MEKLMVGAARAAIDPTPDMFPMPTGFGVCEGQYDSCNVRVIALDSGSGKALLVVFELSDMPTVEGLEDALAAATGFDKGDILITWTHNHTSPRDYNTSNYGRRPDAPDIAAKRVKYKEIELDSAVRAAKEAVASMRPAGVGFGTIPSYINVNRDLETAAGYWVEGPNFAGYSDKTLSVLKFTAEDGSLIAALLNHGTHSVFAMNERDVDGKTKLSSNFSGLACKFVETKYPGAVVMWTAGAAGNQDPIFCHGLQYEYPDGFTTSVSYPEGTEFLTMEFISRRHGADAVKCLESIKEPESGTGITHAASTIYLPAQKRRKTPDGKWINPRMGGHGVRDYDKNPYGADYTAPDMSNICEPDPEHPVEMKMHLVKLGDTALLYTNGEMFAELGTAIKEASPFKNTVVITYSVAPSTSYIVDKSSAHHKVFQAFGAVAPGLSDDIILDGVKALFEKVK